MTEGLTEILTRQTYSSSKKAQGSDVMESRKVPRFLSLGGDHAIALAALRALSKVYGQVAVVHFDARKCSHPTIQTWRFIEIVYIDKHHQILILGIQTRIPQLGRPNKRSSTMDQCFGLHRLHMIHP